MREIRKPNRTGDIFDKNSKVNSLGEFKEPKKKEPLKLNEKTSLKKEVLTDSEDPGFVEVETLPLPFSVGISVPNKDNIFKQSRRIQKSPEHSSNLPNTPEVSRVFQNYPDDSSKIQNIPDVSRTIQKGEGFPLNPDRMEFLLLDGHAKKLLEALIEQGAQKGPIIVSSHDLSAKTGQSLSHLSDTIIRLKKKGYLKVKKSYGKGIFEINPSVF